MENSNEYGEPVQSHANFLMSRENDIKRMGSDLSLRNHALSLQIAAEQFRYGYQQLWCGVPVIRLPDDIVLLQEIVHEVRPYAMVETGVARGGSLLLNASLMDIAGLQPRVIGIDINIYSHALDAIRASRYASAVELVECDSTSVQAKSAVQHFIHNAVHRKDPVILILDSNHSHDHVLRELQLFAPLLPSKSIVIVADTIIADMPSNMYVNRPWGPSGNPLTAVQQFLATNNEYELSTKWARRGLLTEMRDGVLVKNSVSPSPNL